MNRDKKEFLLIYFGLLEYASSTTAPKPTEVNKMLPMMNRSSRHKN
jgi:hypothetical protein